MPSFNAISRWSAPEIVLSSKNLNSSSKMANWIIVDILKYFNELYVIIGTLLASHFYTKNNNKE